MNKKKYFIMSSVEKFTRSAKRQKELGSAKMYTKTSKDEKLVIENNSIRPVKFLYYREVGHASYVVLNTGFIKGHVKHALS